VTVTEHVGASIPPIVLMLMATQLRLDVSIPRDYPHSQPKQEPLLGTHDLTMAVIAMFTIAGMIRRTIRGLA
jgi:hypothetical protein